MSIFAVLAPISAAEFEVLHPPGFDNVMVLMTGEVLEGDAQRFADIVETLGGAHATLNVQGPGGRVVEALDIGAQVKTVGFATMVNTQAARDGQDPEESGVANARIGAFLNMIGLPLDAITYITTAPPDDFLPITRLPPAASASRCMSNTVWRRSPLRMRRPPK